MIEIEFACSNSAIYHGDKFFATREFQVGSSKKKSKIHLAAIPRLMRTFVGWRAGNHNLHLLFTERCNIISATFVSLRFTSVCPAEVVTALRAGRLEPRDRARSV